MSGEISVACDLFIFLHATILVQASTVSIPPAPKARPMPPVDHPRNVPLNYHDDYVYQHAGPRDMHLRSMHSRVALSAHATPPTQYVPITILVAGRS